MLQASENTNLLARKYFVSKLPLMVLRRHSMGSCHKLIKTNHFTSMHFYITQPAKQQEYYRYLNCLQALLTMSCRTAANPAWHQPASPEASIALWGVIKVGVCDHTTPPQRRRFKILTKQLISTSFSLLWKRMSCSFFKKRRLITKITINEINP